MRSLILIAHNIRSSHNVGSLLRTAEGLGVYQVWLTGYTPYPKQDTDDNRLPYLSEKIDKAISKTALGAEKYVNWKHVDSTTKLIGRMKQEGYTVVALEQDKKSIDLSQYKPPDKLALIVGNEIDGVDQAILNLCDLALEIPMLGKKESFNVAVAAAIALYTLRQEI